MVFTDLERSYGAQVIIAGEERKQVSDERVRIRRVGYSECALERNHAFIAANSDRERQIPY